MNTTLTQWTIMAQLLSQKLSFNSIKYLYFYIGVNSKIVWYVHNSVRINILYFHIEMFAKSSH